MLDELSRELQDSGRDAKVEHIAVILDRHLRRAVCDSKLAKSLLNSLGKSRRVVQLVNLLGCLQKRSLEQDVYIASIAITSCRHACEWGTALDILRKMTADRVELNTITYCAAVSACGKGGRWAEAFGILAEMALTSVELGTITYNAAVSACENSGRWAEALGLLAEMAVALAKFNTITHNAAII